MDWLARPILSFGGVRVTSLSLALFLATLVAVVVIARLAGSLVGSRLLARTAMDRGLQYALGRITYYVLLVAGLLIAFQTSGVEVGSLALILSALGVGIGFGLQNIVIAVDTDMSLVEAVRDRVAVAVQIDSVEADALRAVNATEVDAAVVAIGEDFAAEVLTVAILKELGLETIVARANTDRERRILELVGAGRVISVEVEMGQRVARSLVATDVVDNVALGGGVSLVYWTADERVLNRTLDETEFESKWQLTLLGIRPAGTEKVEVPTPRDHVFREGDVLLLVGADARLAAFTK